MYQRIVSNKTQIKFQIKIPKLKEDRQMTSHNKNVNCKHGDPLDENARDKLLSCGSTIEASVSYLVLCKF